MREIDKKKYRARWCQEWCTRCKNYGTDACLECGSEKYTDTKGMEHNARPEHFEEE
jgi:hypothetical protein